MTEIRGNRHFPGMKTRLAFVLSLLAVMLPRLALAQCSSAGGVQFNCANGGTPQIADYVLGDALRQVIETIDPNAKPGKVQ